MQYVPYLMNISFMKAGKFISTLIFIIISFSNVFAQQINSLTIIPANPTTTDTIKVISSTGFSSMSCNLTGSSVSVSSDSVIISATHTQGMLPATCTSVDTLTIGRLSAGTYVVYYTLNWGSNSTQDTISFVVNQSGPDIENIIGPSVVCEGDSVIFSIQDPDSNFYYSWECFGSVNCSGIDTSVMVYFSGTDTAIIEATVSDSTGSFTKSILVIVYSNPDKPQISGATLICENDTHAYLVQNYDSTFIYNWNCSGNANCLNDTGSTSDIYFYMNGNANIKVFVSSPYGCGIDSSDFIVSINHLPKPDIGNDTSLCSGTQIELDAGYFGYKHEWFEISDPSNILISNQLITIMDSGTYVVRVTDTSNAQCTGYDTIRVYVQPMFVISLGVETICAGETAILSAHKGDDYEWWDLTNSQFLSNDQTIYVSPLETTIYRYIISNTIRHNVMCIDSFDIRLNVIPLPVITMPLLDTFCVDAGIITLPIPQVNEPGPGSWSGKGVSGSRNFNTQIAGAGNHVLKFTTTSNMTGCTNTDSVIINVSPLPNTPIIVGLTDVCVKDSLFYYIHNYDSAFTYTWNCSGSAECYNPNENIAWVSFTDIYKGTIEVNTNSIDGCGTKSIKNVSVNPYTHMPVLNGLSEVCEGDSALYEIENYDSDLVYVWTCTGSAECNDATASTAWIVFSGSDSAWVEVKVISPIGCGDEQSVKKAILPDPLPEKPVISEYDFIFVLLGSVFELKIQNIQEGVKYTWNCFGDVECLHESGIMNEISTTSRGFGNVRVIAENNCGLDTAYLIVYVDFTFLETIVSILSVIVYPNPSDGNFALKLNTNSHQNLKFEVINPLGQIVYSKEYFNLYGETEIPFSLKDQPAGNYYLKLITEEGEMVKKLVVK